MDKLQYKQIKPKKIYDEVAETLYEMIRTNQLKPGDKLDSVQKLAENFQVSRSAIREALTALRAMGLIEMRQGEGTYIKQFDHGQITFPLSTAILMNKDDVVHLLEVRKILESGAAIAAALKRNENDLKKIWNALQEMQHAHGNEELGEKADLQFHLSIAEASQNPLLLSLMNQVSELMVETMKETRRLWLFSKQTTMANLYEEHLEIYKAIASQNADKARTAMLQHLENVERILEKYFLENERITYVLTDE
ncbi:GntR family transcriptional regulator [Bacillus methanolicus]|uniref:FadR/GntR family transcriptional regulator n=1 Tax=Bacillus methanolicus TaxID=1471 RepID=UPI0023809525|nr:FadR/GntR family transcriptional regulator [Bacillus methanolicus]MDE3838253.1 GntR family transcriptional regulator [Bacillus methanolicus]